MKTLIYFDEAKYEFEKERYLGIVEMFQNVIDTYNSLGLPQLKSSEFSKLFNQTDDLIYDKMFEGKEKPHVLGVELHKHKAIELFKKPAGYDNLILEIKNLLSYLPNAQLPQSIVISNIQYFFALDADGKVILGNYVENDLKVKNSFYAQTEKARKIYEFAKTVLDKASELGIEKLSKDNFGDFVNTLIEHTRANGLNLNIKEICSYNYR